MAQTILYIIIGILLFDFVTERVLDYLNSRLWSNDLPRELEGIYDPGKYKISQDYTRTNTRFSMITDTASLIAMLLMLFLGGFAFVDRLSMGLTDNPIWLALLFFGIIAFVADIMSLPFSVYATFVIEERFGFNKTTVKTFVLDKLKGALLSVIIGGGLLALVVWIFMVSGAWFWVITWGVISGFMIFMSMFYSNLIVPLFNKQTPLPEGQLRDAIEAFARKAGFKLKDIYVIDSSKRSSKGNAYFTGLGAKKRIVLYDTLIEEHTTDELVAVLAHEIGHYKKKHTYLGMGISILQTGLMLYILSLFISRPVLSEALGAQQASFHMGLVAFAMLYSPLSLALGLFSNALSRRNEFAADRFAGEQFNANALADALKKLSVNNLSNLRPHPAYVFFYYSHPPLLKRLEALKNLNKIKV
ncbi:MAG TPA: M48 family metallopeptidase [Bacteroidales bacterium]|nr:M48 family metallopeptidase [Bacteroidales bacterium]